MGKGPDIPETPFSPAAQMSGVNLVANKPSVTALAPRQFGQGGSRIGTRSFASPAASLAPAPSTGGSDKLDAVLSAFRNSSSKYPSGM